MNREKIVQLMEYSQVLASKRAIAVVFSCENEEVVFVSCTKKDVQSGTAIHVNIYEEIYNSCGICVSDENADLEVLMQNVVSAFRRYCHGKNCDLVAVIAHTRHDQAVIYQLPKNVNNVIRMTAQRKGEQVVFLLPTKMSKRDKEKLQYYHAIVWSSLLSNSSGIID